MALHIIDDHIYYYWIHAVKLEILVHSYFLQSWLLVVNSWIHTMFLILDWIILNETTGI